MSKILAVLLFIISPVPSFACDYSKCSGKIEKIDLCIVASDHSSGRWRITKPADCGYWSDKHTVKNVAQIKDVFRSLVDGCKKVENLTFSEHGSPGYSSTGLSLSNVDALSGFSCVLERGIDITFRGCDVGRGCIGDMFIHGIAKSMIQSQGTVSAPTTSASTYLPGIFPIGPKNGRWRKLTYDLGKRPPPPETWGQSGLAISDGGTMAEHCKEEISDLVDKVNVARRDAKRKRCKSSTFRLGEGSLSEYQNLANGLSDNQSWEYYKVKRAIKLLDFQLDDLD